MPRTTGKYKCEVDRQMPPIEYVVTASQVERKVNYTYRDDWAVCARYFRTPTIDARLRVGPGDYGFYGEFWIDGLFHFDIGSEGSGFETIEEVIEAAHAMFRQLLRWRYLQSCRAQGKYDVETQKLKKLVERLKETLPEVE